MIYSLLIIIFVIVVITIVNMKLNYNEIEEYAQIKKSTKKPKPKSTKKPKGTKKPTNSKGTTYINLQQKILNDPNLTKQILTGKIAINGNQIVKVEKSYYKNGLEQGIISDKNGKKQNVILHNGHALTTGVKEPVIPKVTVTTHSDISQRSIDDDNGDSDDSDDSNNIDPDIIQRAQDYANNVVKLYSQSFGYSSTKPIHIEVIPDEEVLLNGQKVAGVAFHKTQGIKLPINVTKRFDEDVIPHKINAKGNIAHELFHTVQTNTKGKMYGPGWLSEATANYMAHKLVGNYDGVYDPVTKVDAFEDVIHGKKSGNPVSKNAYSQGSAFMGYLDNKYQGSLSALFQETYRNGGKTPFKKVYGKAVKTLWDEFAKSVESGEYVPTTNTLKK